MSVANCQHVQPETHVYALYNIVAMRETAVFRETIQPQVRIVAMTFTPALQLSIRSYHIRHWSPDSDSQ